MWSFLVTQSIIFSDFHISNFFKKTSLFHKGIDVYFCRKKRSWNVYAIVLLEATFVQCVVHCFYKKSKNAIFKMWNCN